MSRMTKYRASKNSSVTDWLTRKSKDSKRGADYYETLAFLNKLAVAFKWRIYENRTLGAGEGRNYTKLTWYTVLLI